jgi:hypothetical protein
LSGLWLSRGARGIVAPGRLLTVCRFLGVPARSASAKEVTHYGRWKRHVARQRRKLRARFAPRRHPIWRRRPHRRQSRRQRGRLQPRRQRGWLQRRREPLQFWQRIQRQGSLRPGILGRRKPELRRLAVGWPRRS